MSSKITLKELNSAIEKLRTNKKVKLYIEAASLQKKLRSKIEIAANVLKVNGRPVKDAIFYAIGDDYDGYVFQITDGRLTQVLEGLLRNKKVGWKDVTKAWKKNGNIEAEENQMNRGRDKYTKEPSIDAAKESVTHELMEILETEDDE
jgi:hypothetical protein